MVTIGVVEGVAEATAAITKVFSGTLSDFLGKRKFLMILGYALAAVTKPIFPLATSIGWVFGARFVDRRQGIRGAAARWWPTSHAIKHGVGYGLRQAPGSVGAVIGRCWRWPSWLPRQPHRR
jgi:MFS family permease